MGQLMKSQWLCRINLLLLLEKPMTWYHRFFLYVSLSNKQAIILLKTKTQIMNMLTFWYLTCILNRRDNDMNCLIKWIVI